MGRQPMARQPMPQETQQHMVNNAPSENFGTPMSPVVNTPAAPANHLPPRQEKQPIVNMKAVEDVPISNVDFDDLGAIDDILNGNV